MKKITVFLIAVTLVIAYFVFKNNNVEEVMLEEEIDESKGVFISYLEYEKYLKGKEEKEIDKTIKEMVYSLEKYSINTIYLQVRMFSDSIYKSKLFPTSECIANHQGEDIDIDILDTFIKYAKEKKIKIYAWINPYRISTGTDTSKIAYNNPAYVYLNTNHVHIVEDVGIYYNPASNVVKNLIISGVVEIVENYDISGVIFDDYFYPDNEIDLENYQEYEDTISIKDFRLSQVNELISKVYKVIKSINSDIEFGVSPDGNIDNNYDYAYADVKKWLSEDGYIDFIMPQVYYGFYNETKPFIKTVEEWNSLITNNSKLIVALSLYKSGNVDTYAKGGSNEWIDNKNIIAKEIEYTRNLSNYKGYSLYRYEYLIENKNSNLNNEIVNYLKLMEN